MTKTKEKPAPKASTLVALMSKFKTKDAFQDGPSLSSAVIKGVEKLPAGCAHAKDADFNEVYANLEHEPRMCRVEAKTGSGVNLQVYIETTREWRKVTVAHLYPLTPDLTILGADKTPRADEPKAPRAPGAPKQPKSPGVGGGKNPSTGRRAGSIGDLMGQVLLKGLKDEAAIQEGIKVFSQATADEKPSKDYAEGRVKSWFAALRKEQPEIYGKRGDK